MTKKQKKAKAGGATSVMEAIAAELAKRGMVALQSPASATSSEKARRKKKAKKKEDKRAREQERAERERAERALELASGSAGGEEATTAKKRRLPAAADAAEDISTRDVTVGQGFEAVRERSRVRVLYCGKLLPSGRVFDRNDTAGKPLEFVVGDEEVIEGFEDGVLGMRPGGERVIEVPPSRAYGDSPPPGSKIPPGARLQFTVTLLGIC